MAKTIHSAARYQAFLHNLGPIGSFIVVKEIDGIKYFKWLSVIELKALLGI